jgi:hypothetical protein
MGGFVPSETDFFRLLKKDECFLASKGGGGCSFKFCKEAAGCGTFGRGDLICEEM